MYHPTLRFCIDSIAKHNHNLVHLDNGFAMIEHFHAVHILGQTGKTIVRLFVKTPSVACRDRVYKKIL